MKLWTRVLAAGMVLLAAVISNEISIYFMPIFSFILYVIIPQAGARRLWRDAKVVAALTASTTMLTLLFYDEPFSYISLNAGVEMSVRAATVLLCTFAVAGSLKPVDVRYLLYRAGCIRLGNLMSLSVVQLRRFERNARLIFYAMKVKGYFSVHRLLSSLIAFLRTALTIAVTEAEEISVSLASKQIDVDRPMVEDVISPRGWRDVAAMVSGAASLIFALVI